MTHFTGIFYCLPIYNIKCLINVVSSADVTCQTDCQRYFGINYKTYTTTLSNCIQMLIKLVWVKLDIITHT